MVCQRQQIFPVRLPGIEAAFESLSVIGDQGSIERLQNSASLLCWFFVAHGCRVYSSRCNCRNRILQHHLTQITLAWILDTLGPAIMHRFRAYLRVRGKSETVLLVSTTVETYWEPFGTGCVRKETRVRQVMLCNESRQQGLDLTECLLQSCRRPECSGKRPIKLDSQLPCSYHSDAHLGETLGREPPFLATADCMSNQVSVHTPVTARSYGDENPSPHRFPKVQG